MSVVAGRTRRSFRSLHALPPTHGGHATVQLVSDGQKHTVVLFHCSSAPSFGYFRPYFLPDLAERAWPRQTGTRPARSRAGLSRSPPTGSAIPVQGVALAETDGDGPCKEPRLLTGGRTGRREMRGYAAGRVREKVFLVVPRRTNPNKHLLGGLDFLMG